MDPPLANHRAFITATFGSLGPITGMEEIIGGWDSFTYLVNGTWIFQFPRPAAPPGCFAFQMKLLRRLNGKLPSAIPEAEFISEAPLCMGYRRIDGAPAKRAARGEWPDQLGVFLRCLHSISAVDADLASVSLASWKELNQGLIKDFRNRVVPLLSLSEGRSAETLFTSFLKDQSWLEFSPVIVHRDLGPEHILITNDGRLAGIIDWGDAQLGDPAIDFAWLLFGSPAEGERALRAYGVTPDERLRRRALFYHQLGPWHEVTHGIDLGQPDFIASGLAGIRARLPNAG